MTSAAAVYSIYLGQSAALAAAATERMHKSLESVGNKEIGARITWDWDTDKIHPIEFRL